MSKQAISGLLASSGQPPKFECLLGLVARSSGPLGVVGLPGILGRGKRAFSHLNPTFSTTPREAAETWGETKRWAAFYDEKGTVISTAT